MASRQRANAPLDAGADKADVLGAAQPSGNGSPGKDSMAPDPACSTPPADVSGPACEPAPGRRPDRSAPVPHLDPAVRTWPLLVLALPAAIAVWSGWVGIGQMTGFGQIRPLPGIWGSFHLDTAVTLPVGVETYAAFALHAWLTSNPAVSDRTRRFARWSAIAAMLLGISGQVAYHLLHQAGMTRAPWEVTTLVACLPVAVLGMGSALAHLLRSDTATTKPQCASAPHRGRWAPGEQIPDGTVADGSAGRNQATSGLPVITPPSGTFPGSAGPFVSPGTASPDGGSAVPRLARRAQDRLPARLRLKDAEAAALKVIVAGKPISRRSLRSAGLHGSNADLGMLARLTRANLALFAPSDGSVSTCRMSTLLLQVRSSRTCLQPPIRVMPAHGCPFPAWSACAGRAGPQPGGWFRPPRDPLVPLRARHAWAGRLRVCGKTSWAAGPWCPPGAVV